MAINDIVQTVAEARVDARSLSEFVFKPAGFKVARRLAPPVDTLQFYINRFNSLNGDFSSSVSVALSSLNSSVAEADDKVAYIETTVQDAINNTAVEGGVLADTFVTVTANGIGSVPLTLRDMLSNSISPKNFGGKGDGVTDDTQAIKKYIAHLKTKPIASFYLPAGDWFVTETITIDLPNFSTIVFDGVIKSSAKGVPLVILGSYDRNCNGYYFRNVAAYYSGGYANITDEPTKSSVAVLLMNLVTCYGNIAKANGCYYGVKADATQPNGGTSYNHIHLGTVAENVKSVFLTAQSPNGYCNENTFYGGSLGNYTVFPYTGEEVDITVDHNASGFKLNNNLFFRPSVEGNHIDTKAAVISGENNCIFQPRIENSQNYTGFIIELTANSLNCVVSGGGFGLSNETISDLGFNNKYETTQTQFYSGDADGDRAVVESRNNSSSNNLVYSGKEPDGSTTYRVRASGVVESNQYIYAQTGIRWSSGDGTRKDRGLFVLAGSPSGVVTATTGSLAVDTTSGGLYHKRYGGASGWTKSQEVYPISTVDRPTNPEAGEMVFDTTLGKPVWWQGSRWVDATGTTV